METPMPRVLFLIALAVLAGCGPALRGEPQGAPLRLASAEAQAGERVFMEHCDQCHPGGAAGLGPAINDKPLPGFLMRFQVRQGLGSMPAFGPDLIGERDLDALIAYLLEVRRNG